MGNFCSQCGQDYSAPACGPTHAMIASERNNPGYIPGVGFTNSPSIVGNLQSHVQVHRQNDAIERADEKCSICTNPALCSSGNLNGDLVCADCFSKINSGDWTLTIHKNVATWTENGEEFAAPGIFGSFAQPGVVLTEEQKEALRELKKKTSVCVLTPFRNVRKYLPLYFSQMRELKTLLEAEGFSLRIVAAEGDSVDGTRERIVELARESGIPLTVVDTTHGGLSWSSVEDPARLHAMSEVMNAALDQVQETDDIAVWIMSDLKWEAGGIFRLIKSADKWCGSVFAPMAYSSDTGDNLFFWDTWGFRLDGKRFSNIKPYHPVLDSANYGTEREDIYPLDSAGTCLVMPGFIARKVRAADTEAVSFCQNARALGYFVRLQSTVRVFHAPALSRRLLWLSDAVICSGLSKVTHSILPLLAEAGYEIDVVATNYFGLPHNHPYRIWPANVCGDDHSGHLRVKMLVSDAHQAGKQYGAIVYLTDPWNVKPLIDELEDLRANHGVDKLPILLPWLTVDGKNIKGEELNSDLIPHVLTSTEFGAYELVNTSQKSHEYVDCVSSVPFGVDTRLYRPLNKQECRVLVSSKEVPSDAFIIGVVSTNQLRKRLDLVLAYFSAWIHEREIPNAYLYLCLSSSNSTGCDIPALIRYYNLRGRVILNDSYVPEQIMPAIYNAFDVYLSLSQGEGFGLTSLEAMACGVPCVLSDWAAYSSWVPDGCAVKIPCTSTALSSPLNSQAYVIGGVADKRATVNALQGLYASASYRESLSLAGLELAASMPWKAAGDKLTCILDGALG